MMASPFVTPYRRHAGVFHLRCAIAATKKLVRALGLLLLALPCSAQDIEPCRWSHLPFDTNFLGVAYAYTTGDIFLNPVMQIEDGEFSLVHQRGKWTTELTALVSLFTDNEQFLNGMRLEEAPLDAAQGHLICNFNPGLWLGASVRYGNGGGTTIDGASSHDRQSNLGWALSMGVPITRNFGAKIAYIGTRTQTDTGSDTGTFTLGCSLMW
jgi:hypothetical protein